MTWVELTGPVGAGKSVLLPYVLEAWRATGRSAVALDGPGSTAIAHREPGLASRAWRVLAWGAFVARRPQFASSVLRAVLAAPLPWWHRRAILALAFRLAEADRSARRRGHPGVVVVDEGWVHRSVNFFGWTPTTSLDGLDAYLERMPRPDLVVVIDAPPELRGARLVGRGLPKRLRGRNPAAVERFLERSTHIVDHAAAWLDGRGVPVLRVSNDAAIDSAAEVLASGISALADRVSPAGDGSSSPTPVVHLARPFPLPRPDRAGWRRRGRQRIMRPEDDRIREVLARYGVEDHAYRVLDGGGRSLTCLVEGPSGQAVLKRYKRGLPASSILVEHAILLELERSRFPSPRLIRTLDDATLVEVGSERFALTALLEGYVRWDRVLIPWRASSRLRRDSGATLAALHRTLRGFETPARHDAQVAPGSGDGARAVDSFSSKIARSVAAAPPPDAVPAWLSLWDRATEISDRLERLGAELERRDLARTVIHGDYGPYNLLIRPGSPLAVIDLELARRDWRLIDLARAIPRFATNRLGFSLPRARLFMEGYSLAEPLPKHELEALPSLLSYLDLRRTVILWSRFAGSRDDAALNEASAHLRRADDVEQGRHAIVGFIDSLIGDAAHG